MKIIELTLTASEDSDISDAERLDNIRKHIPEHDALFAGFPASHFR
ncbi:hypothetical protein [Alteromonas sp. S005]